MRIFNINKNESIDEVLLLLTKDEASELRDELDRLLNSEIDVDHGHISEDSFDREITISIYNSNRIKYYHPDIKKLFRDENE